MEFQIEKYAVIPKSLKSDEEIQKNMAPESQSIIERAKYLLTNGQNFQKSFVAQNIKQLCSDHKGALDILMIMGNQLIHLNDEILIKEYIKAVSELFSEIQITKDIKQIYSDICFNIFAKQQQQYEIINYCAEILKYLDDLEIYKEGLYLETDNQMYQILKIIEIYYQKFTPELRRQAHQQIKSGMKHKDEKIRKVISEILMNNSTLLCNILTDFDWIDKFTILIYDQCKDVRRSSAQLFLNTYLQNEEIHKSRLILLLENIIQQLDITQFDFIKQISQYIIDDDNLQQLLIEKIRQLIQNNQDNSLLFIQSLNDYYDNLKLFNNKYIIIVDELLLNSLKIIDIKLSLECLTELYNKLNSEIHFKVIQILFQNYQDNEQIFIPYINDIIQKSQQLYKNKIWLQQLQQIYEQFKKCIQELENKGQWFEISNIIDTQKTISKILFLQKDFHQQCIKISNIGSYNLRIKIMNMLIDSIIELDTNEYREQIIQNYLGFINNQNYQLRQLAIEFCIRICRERSRKFVLQYNLINILQLQYDLVGLVRAKLPILLYQLRILFWNDEKEIVGKVISVLQNLMNDKKSYIQQISKEQWRMLQQQSFQNCKELMEQNEIMDERERQECMNLKVVVMKQQYLLNPKKIDVSKSRNQTPTTRLPPINKRQNNMLQIPKTIQPRRQSAQRAIQSKSPQPFK